MGKAAAKGIMDQDRIIAVETSGRVGSAAIGRGPTLVAEAEFATDRERGRDLLPTVQGLLDGQGWRPAEVAHCYVSIGPGSFTGLRVAVSFARALALASGAKICAVPSLAVIAENAASMASPPAQLAAVLDAKRACVFAQLFEWSGAAYRAVEPPRMVSPDRLLASTPRPLAWTGEGLDYHEALRATPGGVTVLDRALWTPRASCVHAIGWRMAQAGLFTAASELVPLYVRRPEAEELWERRHGNGGATREAG